MFAPKYTITNSILKNISSSEGSKEVIESAFLIPAWEQRLKGQARLANLAAGLTLEGNKLLEEEIRERLGETAMRDLDSQELFNLQAAWDYLEQQSSLGSFLTLDNILELHHSLTQGLVADEVRGTLRSKQVVVKNSVTGEVSYSPPPAVEVPFLLEDLINWLNREGQETHPLIRASLTLLEFYRIHPFTHYSNALARLLSESVLINASFSAKGFLSLEEYFLTTQDKYFGTLLLVCREKVLDPHDRDTTPWLDYYCFGVAQSLQRIKDRVKSISAETMVKDKLGDSLILNERQIAIMEYLHKHSQMQNKDFRKIFPDFSDDTVLRELIRLRKMGLVERTGRTKKATYLLVSKESS